MQSRQLPAPTLPDVDFEAPLFETARELDEERARVPPQQAMTVVFERRAVATG